MTEKSTYERKKTIRSKKSEDGVNPDIEKCLLEKAEEYKQRNPGKILFRGKRTQDEFVGKFNREITQEMFKNNISPSVITHMKTKEKVDFINNLDDDILDMLIQNAMKPSRLSL